MRSGLLSRSPHKAKPTPWRPSTGSIGISGVAPRVFGSLMADRERVAHGTGRAGGHVCPSVRDLEEGGDDARDAGPSIRRRRWRRAQRESGISEGAVKTARQSDRRNEAGTLNAGTSSGSSLERADEALIRTQRNSFGRTSAHREFEAREHWQCSAP